MNKNEIIQIRLLKEDFKPYPKKDHYKMVYVDIENYKDFENDLKRVVSLVHNDLPDWDDAPTYEIVLERFKSNSHSLLFYYNDECIGWNWGTPNVCFDYINLHQTLKENELYGGGCFVSKSVKRPADAGFYNYNMMFDYWINNTDYDTFYGYVDYWNKAAIRVNFQNGVKVFDYLK